MSLDNSGLTRRKLVFGIKHTNIHANCSWIYLHPIRVYFRKRITASIRSVYFVVTCIQAWNISILQICVENIQTEQVTRMVKSWMTLLRGNESKLLKIFHVRRFFDSLTFPRSNEIWIPIGVRENVFPFIRIEILITVIILFRINFLSVRKIRLDNYVTSFCYTVQFRKDPSSIKSWSRATATFVCFRSPFSVAVKSRVEFLQPERIVTPYRSLSAHGRQLILHARVHSHCRKSSGKLRSRRSECSVPKMPTSKSNT